MSDRLRGQAILAAARFEIAAAAHGAELTDELTERRPGLVSLVERCYGQLRALPRGARRALQRRLARSRDLAAVLSEWLREGAGRTLQRRLASSLAGAALLLALGQGTGEAVDIIVTTTTTAMANDGECSLIEAIENANADSQVSNTDCLAGSLADKIILPTGTHLVTAINDATYETGLPAITSEITIEGQGATIQRKGSAPPFGLFAVSATGNLTLRQVTVKGGRVPDVGNGGGIHNVGTLTVEDSTISGNRGFVGGGIYNEAGIVTVKNSTISGNSAVYIGGGIYDADGEVTVEDSVISKNKSDYAGAGIATDYGTVVVERTVISGNKDSGGLGGGIFSYGGDLTVRDSTITGNKADFSVPGLPFHLGFGGGIASVGDAATTLVENSTISKNTAKTAGGGIASSGYSTPPELTVRNSTISGNKAGSGPYGYGGGIANYEATLIVENSTITGNKARGRYSYGGGIVNVGSAATATLRRTLIAGNKAKVGPEVENDTGGTVTAADHNLFGLNDNAGVVGVSPGATDVVPGAGITLGKILGPLKANGGLTMTHALKTGSPALDVIPSSDPACTGTDQRGVDRPQPPGGSCDIGAFELE